MDTTRVVWDSEDWILQCSFTDGGASRSRSRRMEPLINLNFSAFVYVSFDIIKKTFEVLINGFGECFFFFCNVML